LAEAEKPEKQCGPNCTENAVTADMYVTIFLDNILWILQNNSGKC